MTNTETAAVLAVIKTAYPRYYESKTKRELQETISLWQTMLAEYAPSVVNAAVKSIIATSKFPALNSRGDRDDKYYYKACGTGRGGSMGSGEKRHTQQYI